MKLFTHLFLLTAFFCFPYFLVAQNQLDGDSVDILLQKIKTEQSQSLKLQYAENALKKAEATENDSVIIKCRNILAMLYYNTSQFEKSREQRAKLRDIYMPNDSMKGMGQDFLYGSTYIVQGEYSKGLPILQRSADWLLRRNDTVRWTIVAQNIAVAYTNSGKTDEAIELYLDILPIKKMKPDTVGWINALTGLGRVFFNTNDYTVSEKYYKQALELCSHPRFITQRLAAYSGIANNLANREEYDSAKIYFIKVVDISKQRGDTQRWATALGGIGWNYIKQDSFSAAKRYLEEAFELYKKGGTDNNLLFGIAKNLSRVYLEESECEKGLELLNTAYPLAKENKDSFNLHRITYHLTEMHHCLDNGEEANRYFKEYDGIDNALFESKKQAHSTYLANFYSEKEEREVEKLKMWQALNASQRLTRNVIVGTGVLFFLLGIGGYFVWKRTRKNIAIILEENELLQQENEEIKKTDIWVDKTFVVQVGKKKYVFRYGEILCINSRRNNTSVHLVTDNGYHTFKLPLKDWHKKLSNKGFAQTHQSFIVNLRYVNNWDKEYIILDHTYQFLNNPDKEIIECKVPIGGKHHDNFSIAYKKFKS